MAISYPLALPASVNISSVTMRAQNAVAYDQSPFTFAGQAQAYAGQAWGVDVVLPPMRRSQAAEWAAWLLSLRGRYGTFLCGDPSASVARGALGGAPIVDGAGQTGSSIQITGATPSVSNWIRAGDYVQFGSGATSTLHQVLQDASSDGAGDVTLTLWPHVRTALTSGSIVVTSNAVGVFRLAGNEASWSVDNMAIFGVSFSAVEVI